MVRKTINHLSEVTSTRVYIRYHTWNFLPWPDNIWKQFNV